MVSQCPNFSYLVYTQTIKDSLVVILSVEGLRLFEILHLPAEILLKGAYV
jgi:hypothetical protein